MPTDTKSIVKSYLDMTGLTLKDFGVHFGVGHATVINWRDGKTAPETDLMLRFRKRSDWTGAFAKEILHAKGFDNF